MFCPAGSGAPVNPAFTVLLPAGRTVHRFRFRPGVARGQKIVHMAIIGPSQQIERRDLTP
jgi:hypothetical protein